MKNRSMKWGRFFETLIYTILISLPLISVFARTIYAQSNLNAKDSYTAITDVKYSKIISAVTSFENMTLYFTYDSYVSTNGDYYSLPNGSNTISYSQTMIDFLNTTLPSGWSKDFINTVQINNERINVFYNGQWFNKFNVWGNTLKEFSIVVRGGLNIGASTINVLVYQQTIYSSTLDNSFETAMTDVVNTYGSGNINFINWFGTMFFPNVNTLYLRFLNMYLNYSMLVSVVYLIYYFLIFFVKIIRNLVDSFIKKGESW